MTLPDLKCGDKGHVDLHKNIRARLLDVRDYASIQAAIDAAFVAGIGDVFIPDGVWNVPNTIFCKTGVNLRLAHNATLKAVADVNVLKLAPRGGISGGQIDCTLPGFSKSAILVDGNLHFYLQPTHVSDVQITGAGTGTGIRMEATQKLDADPYPYVFGVIVSNFGISGFAKGLHLEVTGNGSTNHATVNANTISNGYFDSCTHAIYMNGAAENLEITGNLFANITVQPTPQSVRALYCDGAQNMFSNFFVWDWLATGQATAIELVGTRNLVTTNRDRAFVLVGENKVITPDAE